MQSPQLQQSSTTTTPHRHHAKHVDNNNNNNPNTRKPDIRRAHHRHHTTNYILQLYNGLSNMFTRNFQVIILFVGLVITALVQPLFVTFMILLWIGDETFRSYFLKDIMSLVTLGNPTGTVFELLMKWSTITFVFCILCLLVCVTAYLKWKDQQGRGILSLIASHDFSNKLKPYFIVYYSAWLLIYWFEITVIFFGYLGKLALMLAMTVRGDELILEAVKSSSELNMVNNFNNVSTFNNMSSLFNNTSLSSGLSSVSASGVNILGSEMSSVGGVMMDVNAEHNFIGLCVLVLFVIVITIADFVVQDIFNLRTTTPEVRECQRQE